MADSLKRCRSDLCSDDGSGMTSDDISAGCACGRDAKPKRAKYGQLFAKIDIQKHCVTEGRRQLPVSTKQEVIGVHVVEDANVVEEKVKDREKVKFTSRQCCHGMIDINLNSDTDTYNVADLNISSFVAIEEQSGEILGRSEKTPKIYTSEHTRCRVWPMVTDTEIPHEAMSKNNLNTVVLTEDDEDGAWITTTTARRDAAETTTTWQISNIGREPEPQEGAGSTITVGDVMYIEVKGRATSKHWNTYMVVRVRVETVALEPNNDVLRSGSILRIYIVFKPTGCSDRSSDSSSDEDGRESVRPRGSKKHRLRMIVHAQQRHDARQGESNVSPLIPLKTNYSGSESSSDEDQFSWPRRKHRLCRFNSKHRYGDTDSNCCMEIATVTLPPSSTHGVGSTSKVTQEAVESNSTVAQEQLGNITSNASQSRVRSSGTDVLKYEGTEHLGVLTSSIGKLAENEPSLLNQDRPSRYVITCDNPRLREIMMKDISSHQFSVKAVSLNTFEVLVSPTENTIFLQYLGRKREDVKSRGGTLSDGALAGLAPLIQQTEDKPTTLKSEPSDSDSDIEMKCTDYDADLDEVARIFHIRSKRSLKTTGRNWRTYMSVHVKSRMVEPGKDVTTQAATGSESDLDGGNLNTGYHCRSHDREEEEGIVDSTDMKEKEVESIDTKEGEVEGADTEEGEVGSTDTEEGEMESADTEHSGTSYPNFFLLTRGKVVVNNLDVETVIDFCVQDGEFEITVSHRGISTDNQVSNTENTEDRELDTRTAIAADSTETDIRRELQSDTVSEHIITNGIETRTQPHNQDNLVSNTDTLKYQVVGIDDAGKILPDDKNLDSDARNFTGIDGPSDFAAYITLLYMKQFTIDRDTLDKSTCRPGLPLDEEVPEILQKEALPDEIVDKFNECRDRLGHFTAVSMDDIGTLSDDYSGTSYPNFFLSTRGEVLVNNLDVETVIDFCVQDGEFEITVSHRGISTDNQVSKTENTEDQEFATRTAIAADSTETDISRVLQSDTVSEYIIINGRTQPQNQDNLVSNTDFPEVESAHTEDGGEESAHTEDGGWESADTEEGVVESADSVEEERDVTEVDTEGEEEKEESVDTATGDRLGNSLSRRFQPHVGSTGTEQEESQIRVIGQVNISKNWPLLLQPNPAQQEVLISIICENLQLLYALQSELSDHVYKAKLHTNARLVISIQPEQVQSFIQFLQSMNARVSHGVVTESTVTLAAMAPYVHEALEGQSDVCSSSCSEVDVEWYDGDVDMTEGDVAECRSKTKGRARASHRKTYMHVPAMAASEGERASVHHPVTERDLRLARAAMIYDARQGDTDCDSFDDVAHVEFMTDNIADHIK